MIHTNPIPRSMPAGDPQCASPSAAAHLLLTTSASWVWRGALILLLLGCAGCSPIVRFESCSTQDPKVLEWQAQISKRSNQHDQRLDELENRLKLLQMNRLSPEAPKTLLPEGGFPHAQ